MGAVTRLKNRQDFVRLSRLGVRKVLSAMIVLASRSPCSSSSLVRVGFTASRKIGGAVKRNRAKRRMRSLIQEILKDLNLSGIDFVFIAREKILTLSFNALKQELEQAIKSVYGRFNENENKRG